MTLTIINSELTRELLPMLECIDAMSLAMQAASSGSVSIPPRSIVPLSDKSGVFVLMPGTAIDIGCYGAKIISAHGKNPSRGLPLVQGFVTLFDHDTGVPLCFVEGAEITAIRTAAASGLATRLLAREDARSCGILGAGVQARTHIDAMLAVRPVEEILVWGRNHEKTELFAAEQSERIGMHVQATKEAAEACACDLVCTVTGSPEPVIFGEWVKDGAHINLAGAHSLATREADTALIAKSSVYIDLMESLLNEGGDIMTPIEEGVIDIAHVIGEIGNLILGNISGRVDENQITIYNSLGMTAQDIFAARHVYQTAQEKGLGVIVDF
jgi:ornithine cyclodeaminase/alanine dehydrogenase-like protein (mu-crystallin family)